MMAALAGLFIIFILMWIGFAITGAVLMALFWVIKLPIALLFFVLGIGCCCTILLIPLGLLFFKIGLALLF